MKRRFKKIINFKNFLLDIKSHAISVMREEGLIEKVLIRERRKESEFLLRFRKVRNFDNLI
jgi:hypothetical protein